MKTCFLFVAWLLAVMVGYSQGITWKSNLGGGSIDRGNAILEIDGGYIIAGSTASMDANLVKNNGGQDFWLVKIDDKGQQMWDGPDLWHRVYGGSKDDYCLDIVATSDGGYFLLGYTYSNDSDVHSNHGLADVWLVKTDKDGHLQWSKTYGGSRPDFGKAILATNDGNYLIAGYVSSNDGDISGNHGFSTDSWLCKIDGSGNILWQECYGSNDVEVLNSIEQTSDGGFIVCGTSKSKSGGDITGNYGRSDYWLFKTDSSGVLQWQKNYGGSDTDNAISIVVAPDGYLICGSSNSEDHDLKKYHGYDDYWIVKVDDTGKIEWTKTLGGKYPDSAMCIIRSTGGGYVMGGFSFSKGGNDFYKNYGGCDYWIHKMDDTGRIEWSIVLGGSLDEKITSIIQGKDGNYVAIGNTWSNDGDIAKNNGLQDVWVIKIDKFPASVRQESVANAVKVYPTITSGKINVSLPKGFEDATISLHTISGALINTSFEGHLEKNANLTELAPGVYLLKVQHLGKYQTFKVEKY